MLKREDVNVDDLQVPVMFPSRLSPDQIRTHLSHLTETRIPYHSRYLRISILFIPLTSLFMVVPGPNVPLFWNLFRVYSHWKAREGLKTLQAMQEHGLLKLEQDERLERCLEGWNPDKEEIIPDEIVKKVVKESEWGGPVMERDVERVVMKVKKDIKKQASEGGASHHNKEEQLEGVSPSEESKKNL
ncbi:hypothetical protein HK104_000432 [Borealophlyctis nickersoniae]|nr:hypothetical protein HK104_000432 [Borealophlyctis nickersoniae]